MANNRGDGSIYQAKNEEGEIKDPKTGAGKRTVSIPENDQRAARLVGDLFGSAGKPGQKPSPRIIRIDRNLSESEAFPRGSVTTYD